MTKIEKQISIVLTILLLISISYIFLPNASGAVYYDPGVCIGADYCDHTQDGLMFGHPPQRMCSSNETCCDETSANCESNETSFYLNENCICLENDPNPGSPGDTDPDGPPEAVNPTDPDTGSPTTVKIDSPWPTGPKTVNDVIKNVTNWVLGIAGSLALLFIIISGVRYITSAGNQQQHEAAKKNLSSAIIGLVIVLLSALIVNTIWIVLTQ